MKKLKKQFRYSEQISEGETYRISIEKRNSNLSSQEIISKIANKIKNKVSLEFPDKIVLIEILGNKTGISILEKSDVLSVEKLNVVFQSRIAAFSIRISSKGFFRIN